MTPDPTTVTPFVIEWTPDLLVNKFHLYTVNFVKLGFNVADMNRSSSVLIY